MKSQTIISDFSAGELSARIWTRGFSEKYQTGLQECTNFTILPQGGAFKTPGFEHSLAAYDSTSTRGVTFSMAHENDEDITLEFGNLYCRIVKAGVVINSGSNLTTPYTTAQINDLQFYQDANTIYIVHGSHQPRTIKRTTDASWAIDTISFVGIPQHEFQDASSPTPTSSSFTLTEGGTWIDGDSFILTLSTDVYGTITTAAIPWSSNFDTLVESVRGAIFNAFYVYFYYTNTYVTFTVTNSDPDIDIEFTGSWAIVNNILVSAINSANGTMIESGTAGTSSLEDAWSDTRGWPRTVVLHEQRLIFGGTSSLPNHVWGSATGVIRNFTVGVNDNEPFSFQIKGGRHGVAIEWVESKRVLTIGTSSGDYIQSAIPFTPSNVNFLRQTSRKSAYMQPVEVDSELFYVQRGKTRLRNFAFEDRSQNWQTADATFIADHMPNTAIRVLGYAENPDSVIYAVTEDNYMICMTYDRTNQVAAWWRRVSEADILSAWTIHNPTTGFDEIHVIVTYSGSKYLWKMRSTSERVLNDAKSGAGIVRHQQVGNYGGYLDGFITYDFGTPTTSITGLPWADGTVVSVVGDDARQPDKTVSGGAITVTAASYFVVGLAYTSKLITLPLEGGNKTGTSQAQKRRFADPHLRLVDSWAPKINGKRAPDRPSSAPMDSSSPLINGDVKLLTLGYGNGQLTIEADLPFPCQITGIFGDISVGSG